MRGLDPRIHAVAGVASACYEDVDGRIKSGHDDSELQKGHCAFGSLPMANSPDSPAKARDADATPAYRCSDPEQPGFFERAALFDGVAGDERAAAPASPALGTACS